ncbi:hypothetical protein FOJ82_07070 [Tessaracoccus rhinocerotis]|uniref:Uncharacterized protein n=1 Tax=Tessaracoccus rhinocerotis TaxID=1689449 RepID=A0A553K2B9_9ACTN|nr:hypothetical protein FOJ82_07070 [Tessaracoccus rhinocerotis]
MLVSVWLVTPMFLGAVVSVGVEVSDADAVALGLGVFEGVALGVGDAGAVGGVPVVLAVVWADSE